LILQSPAVRASAAESRAALLDQIAPGSHHSPTTK
jgi:hypothetical protein